MQPRLVIQQKITAFTNKYEVYASQPDGSKAQLIAFAQQKRLAFKEKVIFYGDSGKTQVVFSFRAEKVLDVHGRFIVEDAAGQIIGSFKKEFAKSLINSTWNILGTDDKPVIQVSESDQTLAILRRFGGMIPIAGDIINIVTLLLRYHFIFTDLNTNQLVGTYQKTKLIRDHYLFSMTDESYNQQDWRVLTAMSVALDALQSR